MSLFRICHSLFIAAEHSVKHLLLSILICMATCLCVAQEKPLSNRTTPVVQAVANALPWVVNIGTEALVKVNDGYDDFFTDFYFFRLRRKSGQRKRKA